MFLRRVSLERVPWVTSGFEAGEGRGQGALLPGGCCGHAPPCPPSQAACCLLPASVGSPGSSSKATSRLGPLCLPMVPGATQEVGGEGQEATAAGGALGVGLCVRGARALTLPPGFLSAQSSV